MIGSLVIGLMNNLISVLQQDLQLRSRPNQGIWNSLQSMLWTTVLSYPLGIALTFGITELPHMLRQLVGQEGSLSMIINFSWATFPHFLLPGIFGALLIGFLTGGGLACIQHICLRLILWQSGLAPWNLARFLDYCVERRLLQRVGGRYRFLHRELLDHFAQRGTLGG
jgi:hypothetical protein